MHWTPSGDERLALIDARRLPPDETLSADLCIIGGGPVGLTLAHALIGAGLKILLVESGGAARDRQVDALSGGETSGDRYAPLTLYRRRMLGGASTIWGGRLVPYDPLDFTARPHVPDSGWPFAATELAPWYALATDLADAGPADFDAETALPDAAPLIEGFRSDVLLTRGMERFSLPTDFWKKLGPALKRAKGIDILTHATCTHLAVAGNTIGTALFQTLGGGRFRIRAARYVLAAGGIETYRLLAASNDVQTCGIGNTHDVLGRYFMSHVEGTLASLRLFDPQRPIHWGFDRLPGGIYARRRLSLAAGIQRRHRLLNTVLRLHHAPATDPAHGHAVLSTMFLAKSFVLPEYRRKITMVERDAATMASGVGFWLKHARNIATDAPGLAGFLGQWIWRRHLSRRRIPHVVLPGKTGLYPLDFNAEQVPHRDSRLCLAGTRDHLGVPFARVDWRMTEADVRSIALTHRLMAAELEAAGIGTIDLGRDPEARIRAQAVPIGGHHIGAARMSADPRKGVVDAGLRVHGVPNLHVVSTAVLPTSSHANPTLTVLALALRLAHGLRAG